MKKVFDAILFAVSCHKNQVDKAGEPYIEHCIRVARSVEAFPEDVVIAALLHNTVEDKHTDFTVIEDLFGKRVEHLVKVLTRIEGETYEEYIKRVSLSRYAKEIKIADLRDNLDEKRLSKLPEDVQVSLRRRYDKALEVLL